MQVKPKPCKGIGKAQGFQGCKTPTLVRRHGLCTKCLSSWMLTTNEGGNYLKRTAISATKKVKAETKRKNIEEKKAREEKSRTIADYKKLLETQINNICRLIDKGCACISCSSPGNSAGHFHSVAANGSIRYNLHNLHIQEHSCNVGKGGNVIRYGDGLIEVYGKEYYDYCRFDIVRQTPSLKLFIHEYKEALQKARKIVKRLKSEDKTYTPSERVSLRTLINQEIGLYSE